MRDDELRAELIDFVEWMGLSAPVVDAYIAEMRQRGEW